MNNGYYSGYPYFNNAMSMRSAMPMNPGFGAMNNMGMGAGMRTGSLGMGARSGGLLSSLFGGSRAAGASAIASGAGAKGFSFAGLLNGASKTLGIINQAIPVVYQIRPIWNNAKTMFRVAKELGSSDNSSSVSSSSSNSDIVKNVDESSTKSSSSSSNNNEPQFFI